jgi:pimeloyl-ACP methyl ester carboxylesterase
MKLLLLHALPLDERMWEPQREALWEHELETPNLYALTGQSMDAWAMELLRDVWGEFALVGASMGGYCALALARLAPERVLGLVLAGARADPDTPERRDERQATIGRVQSEGARALWDAMSPVLTAAGDDEVTARIQTIALEQRPEDLTRALRTIRDRPDASDVVASLQAPLLVLSGENDLLLPPGDAKALAGSAPQGKAVVLDGAGHLPSLEQSDRFNDELLDFLGEVG